MSEFASDYDVIVVGAGNTALLTALRAHEFGARVLVLEIAPKGKRGGNAYYTTGIYRIVHNGIEDVLDLIPNLTEEERNIIIEPYTADDFFREYTMVTEGFVDPSLTELIVHNSTKAIRWMVKKQSVQMELTSVFVQRINGKLHFVGQTPICAKGGGAGLSDYLFDRVEKMDGIDLLYETGARKLLMDEMGKILGVITKSRAGMKKYTAKSVVLSCGGFESNPAWRARYLGPDWDLAKVRGGQFNMGDGIQMALDVGAQPFGNWSCCHATFVDADAPQPSIREDTDKTAKRMYIFGLIINSDGERFLDEGYDNADLTYSRYGKYVLAQPGRIAFQVFDAKGYKIITSGAGFPDMIDAPYTRGDTAEELAGKLGMPVEKLVRTISDFNKAANKPGGNNNWYKLTGEPEDMHTEGLPLAKSSCAYSLDTPPYYAYAVNCGITFTYGGLKTNKRAQVLDNCDRPIEGLYASGEIIGGLFFHNYAGATGQLGGAIFALIAGKNAVLDHRV
ncbi:MAG: FAD-dependent tricarballylate dehydrogenase TcuA [Deltaproteobacteria bacterium]|nr:FAD-dependent tricarballylate dehydrogenase TcuA [Deltaproteobacteria bacterium]